MLTREAVRTGKTAVPPGNPRLAPHVRLAFDGARGAPVLLAPESVTTLNDTGAAIVRLCDGTRTPEEIVAGLRDQWADVDATEVLAFLKRLAALDRKSVV